MNKIVTSLALIASPAEYYTGKCSAAWSIRNFFTNSLVWGLNRLITLQQAETLDEDAIFRQQVILAGLRTWARESNTSGFMLDFTEPAVRKTLGLEKQVDPHEEACRLARTKCMQRRSVTHFKAFYDEAIAQLENMRAERERRVSEISSMCHDDGFTIEGSHTLHIDNGATHYDGFVSDEELYDENLLESYADRLAETIGNALESLLDLVDTALAGAITSAAISRLNGYRVSIRSMMEIAGVDHTRIEARRAAIKAQIDNAQEAVAKDNAELQQGLDAQVAAIGTPQVVTQTATMRTIKSPERLAREAAEAAAALARQAEDAAKAKRSAAARKGAAGRKAKSMAELGQLVTQ